MSILTMVLEPHKDGTLHLPIPDELRGGNVKVIATLEPAPFQEVALPKAKSRKAGSLKGPIWMADDFDEPLEDFKEYME